MRFPLLPLLLIIAAPACAADAFFAPAQTSGSVEVRLHPTQVVTAGTPRLITFGMPFPRGSITAANLTTLRVEKNGVEIPAYVQQLTPWRHRSNPLHDGTSVRVARIQIQNTFASPVAAETISVSWGGTPRLLNVATLTNPRSAWHRVDSGSFVSADNVDEPDVYAVLPASWLSQGLLKPARSTAFDPGNTEARDSPAAMDAIASWPSYQESERALKNNFYSVINRDDPLVTVANQCPYKTQREPWLYDRAATMFILHFRSGSFTALREAVQATQFYFNQIDSGGFFGLAPGDSKYAYNESLAYAHWLTGDDLLLPDIALVTNAQAGFQHAWSPPQGFWTERHAAFKLLANVVAYEVLGGNARRDTVNQILADLRTHQDGAGGAIPAQRIDGGLYHFGSQHDSDWDDASLGASSWMTALLTDAVVRAYASGEDVESATFVRRMGIFYNGTLVQTEDQSYGGGALWMPRYAILLNGADGQINFEDIEHSLDVAGQLAWAAYFADLTSQSSAAFRNSVAQLYASYDIGVNHWIRPAGPASGLPAFRLSPWRKWGWEHRTSDGIGFALQNSEGFANGFE
jgi:hypothetical protein